MGSCCPTSRICTYRIRGRSERGVEQEITPRVWDEISDNEYNELVEMFKQKENKNNYFWQQY